MNHRYRSVTKSLENFWLIGRYSWRRPGIKFTVPRRLIRRASVAALTVLLTQFVLLVSSCAKPVAHETPAAAPSPVNPVNRVVTLDTESGPRFAIVHHPPDTAPGAPLVVVLHGAYGTAQQVRGSYGWDALADRNGFVVAYPNGSEKFWNAGFCCGPPHAKGVDDVGFLHRLETTLVEQDGVDPHRVYAVGMSNGAMMTYAWACERPNDLAAIGPVAGALVAPCDPAPEITVVAVHGTADRNVPIRGGPGNESVTHFRYPSLAATLAPFVSANGCDPAPIITHRPGVQVSTWNCAGDHSVVLAVVQGMGHSWPGAKPLGKQRLIRQLTSPPLDATNFLWANLRSTMLG
jgi:polyhydroxybutyrate depolymerase